MAVKQTVRKERKMRFNVYRDEQYVDLNLYQFGWEECEPLHSFGPYIRNHYLFHYVIRGKGQFNPDGKDGKSREFIVKAGEGFLIYPHQVTQYAADEDDPWEYAWLEFDGMRVADTLRRAGLSEANPIFKSETREDSQRLQAILSNIIDSENPSGLYLTGQTYLFLDQMVKASVSKTKETAGRLRDFYMMEAINYIERYYVESLTVESVAAAVGLNRSYFSKLFKEAMGQSPQNFITTYRMSKATQLLKSGNLPIADVAAAVGYPNPLHFSRAFKNIYDISPSGWRRQIRELQQRQEE